MASSGQRFGPYRCVRKLGNGGMAETWLAVQRGEAGFEQRVCLKLVHEHLRDTGDFLELFIREAAIAASLRHSNIVRVIDASPSEGCMALELIDGTDLRNLLAQAPRQRLTAPQLVSVGIELSKALHYAHSRTLHGEFAGIVHRDVSPANVLVSYAGEVKLTDFGIAKAIHATGDVGSGLRGKLSYMAPEQLLGQSVDARSDLFALGVVLYEAATSVLPFDGPTDQETFQRIVGGKRRPVHELAPELSPEVCAIIETLLSREPGDRFLSAERLLHALCACDPSPIVYRELGALARAAAPPQTLTVELPLPELEPGNAASPGAIPTRTLPRTPRAASSRETRVAAAIDAGSPTWPKAAVIAGAAVLVLLVGTAMALGPSRSTLARLFTTGFAATEATAPGRNGDSGARRGPRPPDPAPSSAIASSRGLDPTARAADGVSRAVEGASHPADGSDRDIDFAQRGAAGSTRPIDFAPNAAGGTIGPLESAPTNARAHAAPRRSDDASSPLAAATPNARPQAPRRIGTPPASPRAPASRAASRGRLEVGVFPSGQVWIDGKPKGRAPLNLELSAGVHSVAAGQDTPLESRSIEIAAGETASIIFRLHGMRPRGDVY